ncbi:hypothetical protein FHG66_03730 [Rubellimicrobium rubrum]|uniref:Putative Flp pilus-assembly TadG-like N-terminal domain-containing protein n=1 Tax=Rubellimicrobium rubrum TaxID=2585369 RepID=A0A5C4N4Z3_9RHOB|nr:TadE/TadG family type IV pilus assembly protein [Rubellimicrobium rubrum]TNC51930.1 hypothetical protein FHG66_03730 [Rubellimicrobium rubrum]
MRKVRAPGPPFPVRFLRDEDGSMIVFSLFLILAGLIVAGMSIDVMRFEIERSRLQATADRAVLAAANLQQARDPEAVVRDYFEKTGMGDRLEEVQVVQTINQRRVGASTRSRVDSLFMGMLGVPQLTVPTNAAAEESATDIEISLVLDVSYSMQYELRSPTRPTGRIDKLRTAASQFVQTVLENDTQRRISINIVPFNGQVNLGPTLFNRFVNTYPGRIVDRHNGTNSFCLDLPNNAYDQPGLGTGNIPQSGHFDAYSGATTVTPQGLVQAPKPPPNNDTATLAILCRTSPENMVIVGGQSIPALQAAIRNLEAGGYTSINLGMKYGLLFLDPASQGLLNGLVPANRPFFPWRRDNTMKIVVLMTDGENMASYHYSPDFRSLNVNALSPIYEVAGSPSAYYYRDTTRTTDQYWNPTTGTHGTIPSGATQLTWTQAFGKLRVQWIGQQLYARRCGSRTTGSCAFQFGSTSVPVNTAATFRDAITDQPNAATMNTQLSQTCAQARAAGVIVYGIAFDAPAAGQTAIKNCVNPDNLQANNRYYTASNDTIERVFGTIAAQINALRLSR